MMRFLSKKTFAKYSEKHAVTPDKLTKPIRIYCDIDGVVKPFFDPTSENADSKAIVSLFNRDEETGDLWVEEGPFYYKKAVVDKLSEWSKRDDVDFIWLTAWRENAPFALDEKLDIHSVGFLPWNFQKSDTWHKNKGIALLQNQRESPSKFIWLDDFANKREFAEVPYFTVGFMGQPEADNEADPVFYADEILIDPDHYLSITTHSWDGLTQPELDLIDSWLENQN